MTARWARLPYDFLEHVSLRIINEVDGISRVTYDISGKPPSTIEWQGGNPDTCVDISNVLPLLSQRKWYTRVPFGYARGWEPVLYVNNIRSYYNILKWLTANEGVPELDLEIPSDVAPETAEITST